MPVRTGPPGALHPALGPGSCDVGRFRPVRGIAVALPGHLNDWLGHAAPGHAAVGDAALGGGPVSSATSSGSGLGGMWRRPADPAELARAQTYPGLSLTEQAVLLALDEVVLGVMRHPGPPRVPRRPVWAVTRVCAAVARDPAGDPSALAAS